MKKIFIERFNDFNRYSPCNVSYGEICFFALYQSRINAGNTNNVEVLISLDEFANMIELKEFNITWIKEIDEELLKRIVNIPNDSDNFKMVQLFSEFELLDISNKFK